MSLKARVIGLLLEPDWRGKRDGTAAMHTEIINFRALVKAGHPATRRGSAGPAGGRVRPSGRALLLKRDFSIILWSVIQENP
jgi:hypothetical protein